MPGSRAARVDSIQSIHPKTMMSFGQGMRATPSEVSLASTAYSHTGQSMFEEESPPVPRIPSAFANLPVASGNSESASTKPPTPSPSKSERKKHMDVAMARLEGTYAPSDASSASSVLRDAQRRAEEEQRRFEAWTEESQRREAEIWDGHPEPLISTNHLGERLVVVNDTPSRADNAKSESNADAVRAERQKAKKSVRIQSWDTTIPDINALSPDGLKETVRSASPQRQSRNSKAYYPYVADPASLDVAARKLKGLGKKAKEFAKDVKKATTVIRAANRLGSGQPCTPYCAEAGVSSDSMQHAQRRVRYASRPARPATPATPARPWWADELGEPATEAPAPPPGHVPAFAGTISLHEAQEKFLGHPELTPLFYAVPTPARENMAMPQPLRTDRTVADAEHSTALGDFIETRDFAAATGPSNGQNRYTIETPPMSPADFSELHHGEFPSNKRVLYDPELSYSEVEMPNFEGHTSAECHSFTGNVDTTAVRDTKAKRQSRFTDVPWRSSRYSSRYSLVSLVGNAAAAEERLAASGKEGRKTGMGEWQEMMPPF